MLIRARACQAALRVRPATARLDRVVVQGTLNGIMAFKTITIKESAYKALNKFKQPGESFSEVIEREFEQKILTLKDLADWARANSGKKLGLRQRKDSPYRAGK
ncbi:MAG: antitoxin VapB family protein [Opitutaceae bacterium]|nr:antitoxin VapB family protein [Opitutaceae bacterium]